MRPAASIIHVDRCTNTDTQSFPPNHGAISDAYATPPLFSDAPAQEALDKVVMDSLGRRGMWEAVAAMETVR